MTEAASTTNKANVYEYNTKGGTQASTTGNVYGIYDMAGGAWEYVAGYLNQVVATSGHTILESADNKYKDMYLGMSNNRGANYNLNTTKYGDAVYEISVSGYSSTGSWDRVYSNFVSADAPIFKRGGHASDAKNGGIFAFDGDIDINTAITFRPVIICY